MRRELLLAVAAALVVGWRFAAPPAAPAVEPVRLNGCATLRLATDLPAHGGVITMWRTVPCVLA